MSSKDDLSPLFLVAPGTGGHIFPAIAVAQEAFSQKRSVVLVTDKKGFSLAKKYTDLFCDTAILPKLSLISGFQSLVKIWGVFRKHRPGFVIGFGTKESIVPMLIAVIMRISTAIHQSDIVLGRANKFLSLCVRYVFTGYPTHLYPEKRKKHWIYTGTPVRKEFFLSPMPHDADLDGLHILVLGGSQGSSVWAELVTDAVGLLSHQNQARLSITHQHRSAEGDMLKKAYKNLRCSYELVPFIEDIQEKMHRSNLVMSRAGGSTLAEILFTKVPSLLIPYPYSKDDHQAQNADFFKKMGLAWVHAEVGLKPSMLASFFERCLRSPGILREVSQKMERINMPNSTKMIMKIIAQNEGHQ